MTVTIRFYNSFFTPSEYISNIFITSNHKATEKQRLYRSIRATAGSGFRHEINTIQASKILETIQIVDCL